MVTSLTKISVIKIDMTSWRERIRPQPMFDVLSLARIRESSGNYVARMEIGDTPGFHNDYVHELITKYSTSPFRYSPSRGESLLIKKVLETQWPTYSEENIVIGPANFLITAALASVTSPGDLVLLPDPGFASYKLSADFLGLDIAHYPVYKNGESFLPNLGEFILALDKRPKVVMVNNPSNPLGVAFDSYLVLESLKDLPDLGVDIVFDETYINLVYDETPVDIKDFPGIRIRSFSKEHCAPGLRIGYASAKPELATVMADLMSLSISCVPQFIQFAVAEYLGSQESSNFTLRLRTEMSRRLKYVAEVLPVDVLKTSPNAAFYSLLNTGRRNGEEAFKFLLDRNVSTCPGSKFGENSKNSVRVSLAGNSQRFEEDVEMLRSGIADWLEIQNN
jgi:aspartate aminotransferase